MEGGSLVHSLATSLSKNNLTQSRSICRHLSFAPLLLVRDKSLIVNRLFASTFTHLLNQTLYKVPTEAMFHERKHVYRFGLSS